MTAHLEHSKPLKVSQFSRTAEQNNPIRGPHHEIILSSTFTVNPICHYLAELYKHYGCNVRVTVLQNDQIIQNSIMIKKHTGSHVSFVLIFWLIEDLFSNELHSFCNFSDHPMDKESMLGKMMMLRNAIDQYRLKNRKVLFSFPPMPTQIVGNSERIESFCEEVRTMCKEMKMHYHDVSFIDLFQCQFLIGAQTGFDLRMWYLYKQPWSNEMWFAVACEVVKQTYIALKEPIKCIALDCDGTLWGEIVGEVGIDCIQLDDNFPGRIFKLAQTFYKRLEQKGVMLVLLSKNNPKQIWKIFEEHDQMVLERNMIADAEIGWSEKHIGLDNICRRLNINQKNVLYIDDSLIEIEKMRHFSPTVKCFLVPEDLTLYIEALNQLPYFSQIVSSEDLYRRKMIADEKNRHNIKARYSLNEFIKRLGLEVTIDPLNECQIPRVQQLMERTNQFNLTMKRLDYSELQNCIQSTCHLALAISIQDIFGQYGLSGFLCIKHSQRIAEIEICLLSCRVLGRKVEHAVFGFLASYFRQQNVQFMRIFPVKTDLNTCAIDFLKSTGFQKKENSLFELPLNKVHYQSPDINIHANFLREKLNDG